MSLRGKVTVVAAGALVAMTLIAQVTHASAEADVSAIVNGQKIYRKDVMNAVKELKEANPRLKNTDVKEIYPVVVNQIVNEKLVDDAVTAAKIADSKEFKVREQQLLKEMYFERYLKNKVTDDVLKAAYNQFRNENKGKMEVHARHILVPSEVEAKQAIKDLDGGAKFADLAKRRSSGPSAQAGGDLGWFLKSEVIPEIAEAAFSVEPGKYTKEPVKTALGWHVIFVDEKRERQVPDFKDMAGALRETIGQREVLKLLNDLRTKAELKFFEMDGTPAGSGAPKQQGASAAPKTGDAAKAQEEKEAKSSDKKDEDKKD